MPTAQDALARLIEGNRRFATNVNDSKSRTGNTRRLELSNRQEPFAILLGCSDSRVPAEIVFDQGLGDLFVIRVAGNIIAPSLVGSVEFAAAKFGTRLVVVLGHTKCGAIQATLDELQQPSENQSHNILSIVDFIRPSVEGLLIPGLQLDPEVLLEQAVRNNVRVTAEHLRCGSPLLESLVQNDGLIVVGAVYSLDSGVVDFFDGVPSQS